MSNSSKQITDNTHAILLTISIGWSIQPLYEKDKIAIFKKQMVDIKKHNSKCDDSIDVEAEERRSVEI